MDAIEIAKQQSLLFNILCVVVASASSIIVYLFVNWMKDKNERIKEKDERIAKLEIKIEFYERQK